MGKRKVREPRTRGEIGAMLGKELGMTSRQGCEIVDFVLRQIRKDLADGRDVKLSRFGTFKSVILRAGVKRNPYDGSSVEVGERQSVRFKPSRQLKTVLPTKAAKMKASTTVEAMA